METIFFRLDCSSKIGYGHFYRCLTIAQNLKQKFNIIFLINKLNIKLKKFLKINKFQFIELNLYSDAINFEKIQSRKIQLRDATRTIKILDKYNSRIIILDDYKKNYIWEKLVNKKYKLVVINDFVNNKHHCNLLVNPNPNFEKKNKKNKIQTISGSEYIIIRDDFTKYNYKVKIRKNIKLIHFLINQNYNKKLLIYILQTLNTLNSTKLVNIKLQIFSMKKNLNLKKLIKSLKLNFKIELRFEITNLQKYIVRSDLGIGFAGISMYERAYLGLPTITFASSKNQELSLNDKTTLKFIYPLKFTNFNKKYFNRKFLYIFKNFRLRKNLSSQGKLIVNGIGSYKISKKIQQL